MANNYLRFQENYNGKLDKPIFTTIRPDDPKRFQVGEIYDIYLGQEKYSTAIMIKMSVINDITKLSPELVKSDSGLDSVQEFVDMMEKFYGDITTKNWMLITLQQIK